MKRRLLWQIYPAVLAITVLGLLAISWNIKGLIRISYQNEKKLSLERIAKLSLSSFSPFISDKDTDQIHLQLRYELFERTTPGKTWLPIESLNSGMNCRLRSSVHRSSPIASSP